MQGRNSINPVAPTSIVAYAEVRSVSEILLIAQAQEQQFASEEEAIYYLTHKVNNVRHEDGRIYMKLTKDGQLYANSVSPMRKASLTTSSRKLLLLSQHCTRSAI